MNFSHSIVCVIGNLTTFIRKDDDDNDRIRCNEIELISLWNSIGIHRCMVLIKAL